MVGTWDCSLNRRFLPYSLPIHSFRGTSPIQEALDGGDWANEYSDDDDDGGGDDGEEEESMGEDDDPEYMGTEKCSQIISPVDGGGENSQFGNGYRSLQIAEVDTVSEQEAKQAEVNSFFRCCDASETENSGDDWGSFCEPKQDPYSLESGSVEDLNLTDESDADPDDLVL